MEGVRTLLFGSSKTDVNWARLVVESSVELSGVAVADLR